MTFDLEQALALLARTPSVFDVLLRGLPDVWTLGNEGGVTWTPLEIVNHLVHVEQTNWMPRVKAILEFGESQTFAPLNRVGDAQENETNLLNRQLDEFARLRAENLSELRALRLQPPDLARTGRHPAFGVVTLSQLLATWTSHDLTHLHQLSRVLAYQYRDAVGPWVQYLGVLQCAGHSAP